MLPQPIDPSVLPPTVTPRRLKSPRHLPWRTVLILLGEVFGESEDQGEDRFGYRALHRIRGDGKCDAGFGQRRDIDHVVAYAPASDDCGALHTKNRSRGNSKA